MEIQTAACNQNIRIDDFLYGGWADGSWYVVCVLIVCFGVWLKSVPLQVLVSGKLARYVPVAEASLPVSGRKRTRPSNTPYITTKPLPKEAALRPIERRRPLLPSKRRPLLSKGQPQPPKGRLRPLQERLRLPKKRSRLPRQQPRLPGKHPRLLKRRPRLSYRQLPTWLIVVV